MLVQDFWVIDLAPLLCAMLSASCCTLAGTLLFARGQSMTVDAVSHMVLPGMVIAFFISGSIDFFYTFWGALAAAVLGIWLAERLGRRQDRSAVLGMVFSAWFALGIFLLEAFVDPRVHLDVSHILFGSLESIYWLEVGQASYLGIATTIQNIPEDIKVLLVLLAVMVFLFSIFYKEIMAVSFDYSFARINMKYAPIFYYGISIAVTMSIVATFRMIGLILILGMFIIPPLIASFLSDNLLGRIVIGLLVSWFICTVGYAVAVYVPAYVVNEEFSLNVGGTIILTGMIMTLAILVIKEVKLLYEKSRG